MATSAGTASRSAPTARDRPLDEDGHRADRGGRAGDAADHEAGAQAIEALAAAETSATSVPPGCCWTSGGPGRRSRRGARDGRAGRRARPRGRAAVEGRVQEAGQALRGSDVAREPCLPATGPGLPGLVRGGGAGGRERGRRLADRRARALRGGRPDECPGPTNSFLGNPAALKRVFETGGTSLLRGARNLGHDLRHNGGMPSQVDARRSRSARTSPPRRGPWSTATRSARCCSTPPRRRRSGHGRS